MAPTFITKALKRVMSQAAPRLNKHWTQAFITQLSQTSNGDLRHAINNLEFYVKTKRYQKNLQNVKRDNSPSYFGEDPDPTVSLDVT